MHVLHGYLTQTMFYMATLTQFCPSSNHCNTNNIVCGIFNPNNIACCFFNSNKLHVAFSTQTILHVAFSTQTTLYVAFLTNGHFYTVLLSAVCSFTLCSRLFPRFNKNIASFSNVSIETQSLTIEICRVIICMCSNL